MHKRVPPSERTSQRIRELLEQGLEATDRMGLRPARVELRTTAPTSGRLWPTRSPHGRTRLASTHGAEP